jgi:acyl carrier protein
VEAILNEYISTELVTDPALLPLSNSVSLMDTNILDSIKFLNLVQFVEERFDIAVGDMDLTRENFDTVDVICAYIRTKQGAKQEA